MELHGCFPKVKHGIAGAFALVVLAASAAPALAEVPHRQTPSHTKSGATHALSIRGVVVSRDLARHAIVISSPAGFVHTLRLASKGAVSKIDMGATVLSRSVPLSDGTLHSLALVARGHATHAKIRGTVIRTMGSNLILSAGGSDFMIGNHPAPLQARIAGANSGAQPGDVVEATVSIEQNSLQQTQLQQVGQTGVIGLDGVLSSIGATSIVVTVDRGASTTISIPAALSLPSTIAVGDRVEVLAAYANQAFSLITIKDDSLAALASGEGVSQSVNGEGQNVEAEGIVVSVDSTSLVLQPGDAANSVTFAIPTGYNPTGILAGDRVHAVGAVVNGVLTLSAAMVQQTEGDGGSQGITELQGTVTSMNQTSLVIEPASGSATVTFTIPTGFGLTGVVVGGEVHVSGTTVSGALTLTKAEVPDSAQIHVSGPVVSMNPTSLVVQSNDSGHSITFSVSSGFDLSSVVVGATVSAQGTLVSGGAVLTSVTMTTGS